MKKLLLLVLLTPLSLFGQFARYDMPFLPTTPATVPVGSLPAVLAVTNATVSVCGYPATIVSGMCTNKITTYTDSTGGTACPSTAQLTAPGSKVCTSTTGLQGALGFWYGATSSHITYTVKTPWGAFGPYDISPSIGAAGNPASPGLALQFANSGASAFQADPNITVDPSRHAIQMLTDYLPHGLISVKSAACDGGAVGNGIADDTAAANACYSYARANGVSVYWPSGKYKITAPINCQPNGTFPAGAVWSIGDTIAQPLGSGVTNNTTILDELTAPGPVFDCGGDNNGGIRDMTISTPTGLYAGTSSTSGILVSQGNSGFGQGGQGFQIVNVSIYGTGDCSGCAAIAAPGVDEILIDRVQTNGGAIVSGWDLGSATAVNSTFYTLSSFLPNGNPTRETIKNSSVCGDFVPALELTGSQDYVLSFDYVCLGHAGSAGKAIELTWPGGGNIPENGFHAYGIRIENQTVNGQIAGYCAAHPAATGCAMMAVVFNGRSTSGRIDGNLCTDAAGYQIATEGSSGGIAAQDWQLDCTAGAAGLFNIGTGWTLAGVHTTTGVSSPAIGTINSGSHWYDDTLFISAGASFTPANFIAALPSGSVNDFATDYNGNYAQTALNWASAILAAPPAIGSTTPAAGTFTALAGTTSVSFPNGQSVVAASAKFCDSGGANCPTPPPSTIPIRAGGFTISSATSVAVTFSTAMGTTPICTAAWSQSTASTGVPYLTNVTTTGLTVNVPISGSINGVYICAVDNAN